jgi:hypothetical protein
MRQALHIFRKDVRFLWLPMLVVLAMTALFAWSHSADPSTFTKGNAMPDGLLGMISFFLVMCWWYFIACLIYQEQPAGDCQFWVTRPYSWKSLLAAKALAVAAFINVPFLISDMAILWANGFSPARAAASLLGRQIAITAIILVPAAAIAAATRHLAQIAFAAIMLLVLYLVVLGAGDLHQSWHRLAWIPAWTAAAVLAGGMFGALVWQFARRRTPVTRLVLAGVCGICGAMLMAKPFGGAIALESHFPGASENMPTVHLSFAPDSYPIREFPVSPHRIGRFDPATVVQLPIRIDGLPPGTRVEPELVDAGIRGPNGASWRSGWISSVHRNEDAAPMEWSRAFGNSPNPVLNVRIGQRVLDRFQSQPVNVRVSLAMTIFRTETTTQMIPDEWPHSIAGLGVCSVRSSDAAGSPFLLCRLAESPSVRLRINGLTILDASYAPSLAAFAETPVYAFSVSVRHVFHEGSPNDVTTERPIAHLRRDLEIRQIRLGEGRFKR